MLTVVALGVLGFGPAADAATQVGFKAHSYDGFGAESTAGAITGQKPESKLWFLDGKWWAAMLSPANNGAHTIWRLDQAGFVNTGVVIDSRAATKEDVLVVGNSVYITSRSAGASNLLRKFNYSGGNYTLESGFPVSLPVAGPETLTIARDSTGTLWIAFEQGGTIFVAHSLANETTWTGAIAIPNATGANSEDIAAIISFTDATGPAVGVMWSDQTVDAFFFAVHRDGAADSAWTKETALSGTLDSDDHINLKTFENKVYAAVKSDAIRAGKPLIRLIIRSPGGTWTSNTVALLEEADTRPIAVLDIDPATRKVYIFMTKGEGSAAQGIFYKVSSLDSISFGATPTPFIQGPNNEVINDATSMKANATAATGIVVLASDGKDYWWNRIGGGPAGAPPTASAGSGSTAEDTPVALTLTGTDPDTCDLIFSVSNAPAHGSLGTISNQACTAGSPNTDRAGVTYTPAANYSGPDSFTFTVSDGTTVSSPATVSLTVSAVNDAPTAVAASATTSANTPVTVTLTGTDPETCTLNFAISGQPTNGTLGALTNQNCTAGNPNTDRATVTYTPANGFTGSDSFSFTVNDGTLTSAPGTISVTIGGGPTGISLRSVSSAANPTATSLTIPAPAGVASGDVMVASIGIRGTVTITPPSGWSLVRTDMSTESIIRQDVFVKVAGAEPASYTWNFSTNQPAAGGILAFSGVSTTTPIDAHSGSFSNGGRGNTLTAPSVTTTKNGAMLIGFYDISTDTTIVPPSGMTERFDLASNAGAFDVTAEGCTVQQATAGPTGNKTATASGGWAIAQLIALRPA